MRNLKVLVSGASIAGPALAYWLNRYGCTVTVVEQAPALRAGGQAVDFKGGTHRQVLERMGILDDVRRLQTGKTDLVIVDEHDKRLATIPGEFTGGDLEILRGDLATLLYQRTRRRLRLPLRRLHHRADPDRVGRRGHLRARGAGQL